MMLENVEKSTYMAYMTYNVLQHMCLIFLLFSRTQWSEWDVVCCSILLHLCIQQGMEICQICSRARSVSVKSEFHAVGSTTRDFCCDVLVCEQQLEKTPHAFDLLLVVFKPQGKTHFSHFSMLMY